MKNKYVKRAKISEAKFRKIIMCFAMELDSQRIAALTSLNRNTVNRYLNRVRGHIAAICDETHINIKGGKPKEATRTRPTDITPPPATTENSLLVFGIQSQRARIHTEILTRAAYQKLQGMLREKEGQPPIALSPDAFPYDAIVDLNGRWHYRLRSAYDPNARAAENDSRIEAFLNFARKRLTTSHLNGWDHFYYYLKECEFRFNNRDTDLYKLLLKSFRQNPMY